MADINKIAKNDPRRQPSQTEAQARQIRHYVNFDFSDGNIDENLTVDTAAKILRTCRGIPAAEKVEFTIKMPGEVHIGGGYRGGLGSEEGQANAELLGKFFRDHFGRHYIHYGNNLPQKIELAVQRQDQEFALAATSYVDTSHQETTSESSETESATH